MKRIKSCHWFWPFGLLRQSSAFRFLTNEDQSLASKLRQEDSSNSPTCVRRKAETWPTVPHASAFTRLTIPPS
eukprot:1470973-Amphidinium_carterae.1